MVREHHPWMLGLAVFVCLAAAFTTMRMFGHARVEAGRRGRGWLIAAGVSGGAGVWATHFISMLAFDPGLPTGYAPAGTALSLVIAMAGVAAALVFAARARRNLAAVGGGAMLGLSIAAMHATGMSAFRTAGHLAWRPDYLGVALLLGVVFSMLALRAALSSRRSLGRDVEAAALFVVAIVCLHFIGMAAVSITPDGQAEIPSSLLPNAVMALAVGCLAGLIMLAAVATVALEARGQRRSRRRMAGILEAMPDGLAYFDAEDRYQVWNRRYAESLQPFGLTPVRGRTYEACVLRPAMETGAFSSAADPGWLARKRAERQGSSTREERSPDGRWFRVIEAPTADGGRVTSVVDITALKQAAEDLARARDEAEAANRAKSAFLANMSHEIRTPLNGVLGVADALALTALSTTQAELVEIIRSSGGTLNRLLCDILDLARVESGALELTAEPFLFGEAVRAAAVLCAQRAADAGLDFEVTVDAAADVWADGDVTRVKQIVTNLAANAVKFTEAGSVTIQARRGPDGAFEVEVRDTGRGMDAEALGRLFERFQQADGSIQHRYGGSGLGLAICRELAELMGGQVEASSRVGEGSRFLVRLPLAETAPTGADAEPEWSGVERPLKVLVADDNPNNRRLLELLLAHLGAECVLVEDGAQAVEAWRREPFDVVLMDMQMPGMDGLEATCQIRSLEGSRQGGRTPVFMVSANAMPEHVAAGRAAGADLHLSKPLSAQALFQALASVAVCEERAAA
ncbi:ATP-binding protein [Caulobacter sp. KR2-114]|uniref:ATP-binding protein n=1 Tax=Caulobacter sp. KR2-114 TaxID=3400912 RepID=UPI003C11FDE9